MDYGNNVDSTGQYISHGGNSDKTYAASTDYCSKLYCTLPFGGHDFVPKLERKLNKFSDRRTHY